tara:strand:+ start:170 stop:280 length:111 start_codon:yes stop_codon:yes gene_type:complete
MIDDLALFIAQRTVSPDGFQNGHGRSGSVWITFFFP